MLEDPKYCCTGAHHYTIYLSTWVKNYNSEIKYSLQLLTNQVETVFTDMALKGLINSLNCFEILQTLPDFNMNSINEVSEDVHEDAGS